LTWLGSAAAIPVVPLCRYRFELRREGKKTYVELTGRKGNLPRGKRGIKGRNYGRNYITGSVLECLLRFL